MDPASASTSAIAKTENYLYFDPRSANARGTAPPAAQAIRGSGSNSPMPGAISSALGTHGPGTGASFGQRRQGYSEAIVFTVGGGCMEEFTNLQDWTKRTGSGHGTTAGSGVPKKRVVYGSTGLLNPEEFLNNELKRLGKESG
jgi:hypothetical protein